MLFYGLFMYHVGMDKLGQWIEKVTDNASWRMIGEQLGTTHSTIQRRLRQDTATAICEIAAAYDANPIDGLLAAQVVSLTQLQEFNKQASLSSFTDLELAQEIVNRLEKAQAKADDLTLRRKAKSTPPVEVVSDSEIGDALADVHEGLAAAKENIHDYDEPDLP